jgi:hypothetical protein
MIPPKVYQSTVNILVSFVRVTGASLKRIGRVKVKAPIPAVKKERQNEWLQYFIKML